MLGALLLPLDFSGTEHGLQRGLGLVSGSATELIDYLEKKKFIKSQNFMAEK